MVLVNIVEGRIRGRICEDFRGGKFYSFQGVPYAAPPIGHLRFRAPQPMRPWSGILDATKEGSESLHKHSMTKEIVGAEDCLSLNVYTPEISRTGEVTKLKPVMFWIHGGIFSSSSSKTELFGPEFLITEDIVLVTINYRLGLLGFLSLDDPSLGVPGNAALKDMVMALKWVRRNISSFCGDPNNVTVFGESAGAAAAHLLILSHMAKDLFHKVIAQSSCAFNKYVFGRRSARLTAKTLGFYSTDDRKLLAFLQSVPAIDIFKAQQQLDFDDFLMNDIRAFGVVVERPCPNEEAFLTEDPLRIIASGKYNHVPMIMGYNSLEGLLFDMSTRSHQRNIHHENFQTSIPFQLNVERNSPLARKLAEMLRLFYFGDVKVTRTTPEQDRQFFTLVTDSTFFRAIYSAVRNHLETAAEPIYFYRMSIETELNIFKKLTGENMPGVCHADDLGYLFKSDLTPEIKLGSIEDISIRRFTKLWTNFARYSNPTPDPYDPLLNISWKPVDKQTLWFLDIGEELTLQKNPEPERMKFWDEIYSFNHTVSKL